MNNSIKFYSVLAACLLIFAGIYTGCKDKDPVFDPPSVTAVGGNSIAAVPLGVEKTITFQVTAPAGIKSVKYTLAGMGVTDQAISVTSGATEMDAPVTFTPTLALTGVTVTVTDNQDRPASATVNIDNVVDGAVITFKDGVNTADVELGEDLIIQGSAVAGQGAELVELSYVVVISGVAQPKVNIPIGSNKTNVDIDATVQVVEGLERVVFTAKDNFNREVTATFTIGEITESGELGIEIDPTSSRAWLRTATGTIKGTITGGSGVSAKYVIVKNGVEEPAVNITLGAGGTFQFTINKQEYIAGVRIEAQKGEESVDMFWIAKVCDELTHVQNTTLTMEQYGTDQRSFFCAWKAPHAFHGQVMCNSPEEYLDWWDFSVYVRTLATDVQIAAPAAWAKNVENASRVVHQVIPNTWSPSGSGAGVNAKPEGDDYHCRAIDPIWGERPADTNNPNNPEWNQAGVIMRTPRLNYTMISPARPELASVFDLVQTEADLWNLLDFYVESEEKTIREIYDPVTSGTSNAAAVDNGVYWIAWGPKNGSGFDGEKGGPAENGGLGLLRVTTWGGTTNVNPGTPKYVTFDIKFPSWPNYRDVFKDSWVDIRNLQVTSRGGARAWFPATFTFPGWPPFNP